MRWDADRGRYVLASGREIQANRGILGLGPGEGAPASEGYDGDVEYEHEYGRGFVVSGWVDATGEPVGFTPEERREIAGEMIRRWAAWGGEGRDAMTPDERTAEKVLDAWEAHPDWRPDSNRHVLVDLIAAALQAERERCLAEVDRLVEKYEPSDEHICPGVLKGTIEAFRLLATSCATAP